MPCQQSLCGMGLPSGAMYGPVWCPLALDRPRRQCAPPSLCCNHSCRATRRLRGAPRRHDGDLSGQFCGSCPLVTNQIGTAGALHSSLTLRRHGGLVVGAVTSGRSCTTLLVAPPCAHTTRLHNAECQTWARRATGVPMGGGCGGEGAGGRTAAAIGVPRIVGRGRRRRATSPATTCPARRRPPAPENGGGGL